MSERFQMTVQSRKDGRYAFVITSPDKPGWVESCLETYASIDEASVAAGEALERLRRVQP